MDYQDGASCDLITHKHQRLVPTDKPKMVKVEKPIMREPIQTELFPLTFTDTAKYRLCLKYRVAFKVNPHWLTYANNYLWSKGDYQIDAIRLPEYLGDAGLKHIQGLGCTILIPEKPIDPICAYERKTDWPKPRKPFERITISDL